MAGEDKQKWGFLEQEDLSGRNGIPSLKIETQYNNYGEENLWLKKKSSLVYNDITF